MVAQTRRSGVRYWMPTCQVCCSSVKCHSALLLPLASPCHLAAKILTHIHTLSSIMWADCCK